MSGEINSTNMNLPIPAVGVTSGPTWAQDVNNCLTIIDSHSHQAGSGVQITPDGMNISSDLTFAQNAATNLKAAGFFAQSMAPSTLQSVYVSGVDLYYIDGNSNQVRITSGGSVAGASGTITGLPSGTASAAYSSPTFKFQSATNTAANLDGRSIILRNSTVSSFSLTVSPPTLGSNQAVTLPPVPGSGTYNFITMDSAGVMGSSVAVDNSTIAISSNQIIVKNGGVTPAKMGTANYAASSVVVVSISSGSFVDVTGLTVAVTSAAGRPIIVMLVGSTNSDLVLDTTGVQLSSGAISVNKDSGGGPSSVSYQIYGVNKAATGTVGAVKFPVAFYYFDAVTVAGTTYTYQIQAEVNGASFDFNNVQLVAYEI